MVELTTTRQNEMIDPAMHVWGWEIPVYLFLGGLVAGMMVIAGYFMFSGRHRNTNGILTRVSVVIKYYGKRLSY